MGVVLVPVSIVAVLFLLLSVRLFRTALHASGVEGWLAGFFLFVGLAMPARVLFVQGGVLTAEMQPVGVLATHFLMSLALCCFTFFIDRVFRPDAGWAEFMAMALVLLQIGAPVALVFFGGHRDERHSIVLVVSAIRALPFAWGFVEAYRYHAQMRRRLELELADPVVANRFGLFAIWTAALFMMQAVIIGLRIWALVATEQGGMLGDDPTARFILSILRISVLVLGTGAAATLWLSFYPPAGWVERIRARAAPATG